MSWLNFLFMPKDQKKDLILQALRTYPKHICSGAFIKKATGLSAASVYVLLFELEESGVVRRTKDEKSGRAHYQIASPDGSVSEDQ